MRLIKIVVLISILAGLESEASCQKDLSRSRVRRRVVFTKSSKYFYRFNGKLNTLPYNQIVAFGYTVRVNFDLPHDAKSRYLFFKRDIHEEINNMPDELAIQGFSCAMKHICMTFSNFEFSDTCGFFCDLGKIIMREQGTEAQFIRNFFSRCDHYMNVCQHEIDETTTVSY